MILELLGKVLIYGCVGVLMEVFFTGIHSIVILRDRNAISRTSLHMILIYGLGALLLGLERAAIPYKFIFIPVCTLSIFVIEYVSGWVLRKLGIKIWDYTLAKFSIHGLVRVDYLPFWLMVAVAFDILADYVTKILEFVGRVAT